jgi:TetR/AcrR family transcriptional regulator, repressor for uid operon
MPKLKPATQRARREHILDAAEVCFARSGFHRTTMQDICKEALISPGALYVYFASKEDLIAGISERDRADFQERFAELSAAPDFMQALASLGEHYFEEEPAYKRAMCIEIGLESTRNPKVGEIYRAVDRYVEDCFAKLFARLAAEGRIAPELDIPTVAKVFSVIGDGLFFRCAVDPDFDAKRVIPGVMSLVRKLLNPVDEAPGAIDDPRPALEKPTANKDAEPRR